MRLKFRNLYEVPRNDVLSSLESSNRSIVVQTYDKIDNQSQYRSNISNKRTIQSNNLQYSSFEKKLKDYKQNLLHLLQKSKNQKECYMKRMIDLTNQSKSRVGSSRDNYTSISTKYGCKTPLGSYNTKASNQSDQKINHILRPCKSPKLNSSQLSNKEEMKYSRNKEMRRSRKNSVNSSKDKSNSRSSSKYSLSGNVTPKEMNQTHKLMRRKQQLEEELKRLNQNIMLRQKVKSKLSIV